MLQNQRLADVAARPAAAKGNDLMSVDVTNLRRVVGASAAVVAVLQATTAVVAVRRGRRDYAGGV
jgi:hypothetical protein